MVINYLYMGDDQFIKLYSELSSLTSFCSSINYISNFIYIYSVLFTLLTLVSCILETPIHYIKFKGS